MARLPDASCGYAALIGELSGPPALPVRTNIPFPQQKRMTSPALWLLLLIVFVLACLVGQACGCFAVIVGRRASADGSVLVAHNEENKGRRVLYFHRLPGREAAPVRLQRGGLLNPAGRTAGFLWSENPGLEFSDGYLNEHGVAIVSDACPTREDDYETLVARGEIRHGGIGYMLRRQVAEQAATARDGVELIGRLVERFGYVASGRTYVVADPRQAWLVAVVRGRHWVARRVPDDAAVVLPNVHILGEVDPGDANNFLACGDLVAYATARGWFDPRAGRPFDFRLAYQSPGLAGVDPRQCRGQQLLSGRTSEGPPKGPLPFAVRPEKKLTVADLAAVLRDQGGPVPLFRPTTQETGIFQLRAGLPLQIGCVWWRTTGRPDVSVLTPWYLGISETPPQYQPAMGTRAWLEADSHFSPPQGTFKPDDRLAWWRFKRWEEFVDGDYAHRAAVVAARWGELESRAFRRQAEKERELAATLAEDASRGRERITRYCEELAEEALAGGRAAFGTNHSAAFGAGLPTPPNG